MPELKDNIINPNIKIRMLDSLSIMKDKILFTTAFLFIAFLY